MYFHLQRLKVHFSFLTQHYLDCLEKRVYMFLVLIILSYWGQLLTNYTFKLSPWLIVCVFRCLYTDRCYREYNMCMWSQLFLVHLWCGCSLFTCELVRDTIWIRQRFGSSEYEVWADLTRYHFTSTCKLMRRLSQNVVLIINNTYSKPFTPTGGITSKSRG